jgi:DNA polymerase II large subunit
MASSYPIWFEITSCIYEEKKSFGARNHSTQNIKVGSSNKNSHHFATIETTRTTEGDEVVFTLLVDGIIVKESRFNNQNGKAVKKEI